MLVAACDTPEEFRVELLKMMRWRQESEATGAKNAKAQRERTARGHAAMILRLLIQDVERVRIIPKSQLTRQEE